MRRSNREELVFPLFLLSGFCSLLYEVVWMRVAMASFGVITPVMSVVVSVFMFGFALGSWLAGRGVARWVARTCRDGAAPVRVDRARHWTGAFAVPRLFTVGEDLLLPAGQSDSPTYLLFSAVILALALLPWCILMGATVPAGMAFVNEDGRLAIPGLQLALFRQRDGCCVGRGPSPDSF